jgi:hypothetical protein
MGVKSKYDSFRHLKEMCAGCEKPHSRMSREHVFPRWLIKLTNTHKTSIRWVAGNRIPAFRATLPLCANCNQEFGEQLENPASFIFADLESKKGISAKEAELLVRWLWKIDGMFWKAIHPNMRYTPRHTLRERVLRPLDDVREHLVLAISLIKGIDPSFKDKPLGIDSHCFLDAIFCCGVFSHLAILITHELFADMLPSAYSQFKFVKGVNPSDDEKLFFPKYGFSDDIQAVGTSVELGRYLSAAHDTLSYGMQRKLGWL